MVTTTAPVVTQELGLTLPGTMAPGMLAAPRNIKDLMGNPDSSTLINFMKFAPQVHADQAENEVSERLGGIHKQKQAVLDTLAKIGPTRISEINIDDASQSAQALTDAGFGKFVAEVAFDSRNDNKKVYAYTIKIVHAGKKKDDYNRDLLSRETTLPFDAETKKLLKQAADFDKKIETVETELLGVKSDFAKLDDWVEEKKAMLAVQQIAGLDDGRAQLEKFLGKAVVAEMLGAAA